MQDSFGESSSAPQVTALSAAGSKPAFEFKTKQALPWIIYLIFFAVLNETVFNVSTPAIAAQFALTEAQVSWVMTIFMVLFGIGSVTFGKLADVVSLRSLISFGVFLYAGASVLGFIVQGSYPLILVSRALQGLGCSAIPSLVFVLVARYVETSARGTVFGLITSFVSVAIGIGPVLGGLISQYLGWAFLFLVPVPILIGLPLLLKQLPRETSSKARLDIVGTLFVATAVASLMLWLTTNDLLWLVVFAASLVGNIVWMFAAIEPFLDRRVFAMPKYRAGVLVGLGMFAVVMGVFFLMPLLLNRVHSLDTAQIGLLLFPGAMSSVFIGPIAGRLADKRGNLPVVLIGMSLVLASLILMGSLSWVSPYLVLAAMVLTNSGFAFVQTGLINSVSLTLKPEQTGIGMGVFNLSTIIAGAVGAALVGKLLTAGSWTANPFATGLSGLYSNILLLLGGLTLACLIGYLLAFRDKKNG